MGELLYSAGLMSQSFWFIEFKKVVKLVADGVDAEEIKRRCLEENLLGAAKEYESHVVLPDQWPQKAQL